MQHDAEATPNPYDVYLPYLPEMEELERLDALLAEMLTSTQSELDRLAPRVKS
jgi:hypothetical protein